MACAPEVGDRAIWPIPSWKNLSHPPPEVPDSHSLFSHEIQKKVTIVLGQSAASCFLPGSGSLSLLPVWLRCSGPQGPCPCLHSCDSCLASHFPPLFPNARTHQLDDALASPQLVLSVTLRLPAGPHLGCPAFWGLTSGLCPTEVERARTQLPEASPAPKSTHTPKAWSFRASLIPPLPVLCWSHEASDACPSQAPMAASDQNSLQSWSLPHFGVLSTLHMWPRLFFPGP